jgi:O-antigen ligase
MAFIVLACRLAREEDLAWVGFLAGAGVLSLLALVRWPYGALSLLIAASVMPRYFIEVLGWKARPEHFVTVIVSSLVGVWLVWSKRKVRFDKLDYWVMSFVAVNYISSAFVSSSPFDTLKWALLANLGVLPYFVIRFLVHDLRSLRKAFGIFLLVGFLESAYGILCYLANHTFGTSTGMELYAYYDRVAAPYGSMFEPNLFGAYAACTAVCFLVLYLGQQRRRLIHLVCFSVASIAVLLSFSRAALLALAVLVAWVFWKAYRSKHAPGANGRRFVVGFAVIVLIAAVGIGGVLRERLDSLFTNGLQDETAITRFLMVEEALQELPNHPLLGSGTASLQLSFDWSKYVPSWTGNGVWIGNVTVRILHDTGVIGFAIFLGFVISLWRAIRRELLQDKGDASITLIALSAGALLYAITFQATDGTTLAFCWVHLGLLSSAAIIVKRAVPTLNSAINGTPATT